MTPDPALPGIPQDAIDHAANVERARAFVYHADCAFLRDSTNSCDCGFRAEVERLADAITVEWARGFAAGVASTVRKQCRTCDHDTAGNGCIALARTGWQAVRTWCNAQKWTLTTDGERSLPDPDADNCPGWAPKETP